MILWKTGTQFCNVLQVICFLPELLQLPERARYESEIVEVSCFKYRFLSVGLMQYLFVLNLYDLNDLVTETEIFYSLITRRIGSEAFSL